MDIPKCAIAFGAISPPQGDVIDLRVHLGCTKEVSSFELTLENWDKKYSPGGTSPINVGMDGHIDVGRGSNVPQIITCRVESIKCQSPNAQEHYIVISGRCWGEKFFRRVVTKEYVNQKGEAIVKDLMDSYAGISHNRGGTELVEDTDTTFTSLKYEDTPMWDILKYIAESSDKAGVIGYDFRVAPDGKFEFFPKNSKTSPVTLTEIIEVSEYQKDIHRIRNKIMVYGIADKSVPLDKDAWTESLTPTDGNWTAPPDNTLSLDSVSKVKGSHSIRSDCGLSEYANLTLTLNSGREVNADLYPEFGVFVATDKLYPVRVVLSDVANKTGSYGNNMDKGLQTSANEWSFNKLNVGVENAEQWTVDDGFDWTQIKKVEFQYFAFAAGGTTLRVDGLYFGGRRYSAVREDEASQNAYGLRELTETDEELMSDNECDLRARALLDYFKIPAEYLTATTTVIDYGVTLLLPGDKTPIELPNENVDSDFRIESAEYYLDAKSETLEITLELGKAPPQLADYLYGLRATTVTVEKLARTKLGKRAIVTGVGGGGGGLIAHHRSHEVGDETGTVWPDISHGGGDPITGWIAPNFIGPFSDAAAVTTFRTKNKARSAPIDHHFQPSDDAHGNLGAELYRWLGIHSNAITAYDIAYGIRLKNQSDANPLIALIKDYLEFGPGGAIALDTWLHRIAPGEIEVRYDLVPTGDNAGKIGYGVSGGTGLRWSEIHAIDIYASQFHYAGNLLPDADNTYDIGAGATRWRDLYLAGAIKALVGGVAVHLMPTTDGLYDMGAPSQRWRDAFLMNLYVNSVGDLGSLKVGGTLVISTAGVLQNVTAAASIITSGKFAVARLPNGTVGYVLEAEGASDPMYVDPNGRYTPAGHNHATGNITSGVLDEARCPNVYSGAIHFNGGIVTNSVNCANFSMTDLVFENDFRVTEAEKLGLPKGLAFLSPRGRILMVLDGKGNLRILGKLGQKCRLKRPKKRFGA